MFGDLPSEISFDWVYFPPFFFTVVFGLLCAFVVARALNAMGLSRFFWHLDKCQRSVRRVHRKPKPPGRRVCKCRFGVVAFVDSNSFRVHAYFQETKLRHIKPGDRAVVTLMSHHDEPLEGVVDTIGNAVNPPDVSSTEGELGVVPAIEPTFDWVRLAQRVPVRIRLKEVPDNIQLISGTTASVSIEPGGDQHADIVRRLFTGR